jgi:hypothetical protein
MAVSNGHSGNVDESAVAVGKKLCEITRNKSEIPQGIEVIVPCHVCTTQVTNPNPAINPPSAVQ